MDEFNISSTAAFLPLSFYVLALGLGPVLGGPLSETAGRQAVHIIAVVFGGLFALGAGFTETFTGAVHTQILVWGLPSTIFILSPFLGPGLGLVLGSLIVDRKDWRWTQYTIVFFSVFSAMWLFVAGESYHPVLLRRRRKQLGLDKPEPIPTSTMNSAIRHCPSISTPTDAFHRTHRVNTFFVCGCMFGTLFMFFGAFFHVFGATHNFSLTESGLVF
ncbi:major facilitator superfamily transporter [Colletotrichum orchidophilum]|uniref:Major facilitator superfamily transporter n=1 Tax=Colletotrichum orchidophilum TaxID=1209926 RepID=A0A1G4B9U9_9PEZI|nr:major facilitator superfamily transporter [Colletotrichum orchidophilum]OHE98062.1 major facilitator superfamily transporter [Colletotrichum orchidophilum]